MAVSENVIYGTDEQAKSLPFAVLQFWEYICIMIRSFNAKIGLLTLFKQFPTQKVAGMISFSYICKQKNVICVLHFQAKSVICVLHFQDESLRNG